MHEQLSVIGAGLMGHSIALTAAWAGLSVKVWSVDSQDISRATAGVQEKLTILESNGLVTPDERAAIAGRIAFTVSLEHCVSSATFVIEAIPEQLALKQQWYEKLDRMCGEDVVLASNTSGLSPTDIGRQATHKHRILVTHFWNPAHLIPLVEVVRGEETSNRAVERSMSLLQSMNKKPVELKKDVLGSIVNRLQYALFREAQYIAEMGVASVEDIDAAVRYSIGRRLAVTGPFMTADMGGLDVFDSISTYLFPDLSTHSGSLAQMREHVENGRYGQKNGQGFYQWTPELSQRMNQEREQELIAWLKKDKRKRSNETT
ncbi:3-hydroxyacyl-CoA dehydrogenase family protein [Paenibacillus xerothermodurans]|uniref:L-gulonate 3-dehydrogenase n=1 Tax=Paenibacillus xerothermodurans TaxID=1977292 RepID=A0A2W1NHW7_PAEXE|nr:3-hydroxyacyl-CoA dehydrogenase NAD-binding domain-containing protein [Paenibacillus xerothermodurans]PZE22741.1 3-hydroxyacyl-CoA dehydrogenase family protein [Paenibacillus xerothermodurans]